MAAWQDVIDHFEEVGEEHKKRLVAEGLEQRKADFSRGFLAAVEDLNGLLDMLIELANEIEERQDGSDSRRNR